MGLGLAIVVKSKFAVESVGSPAPNWIFVRVFGSSLPNPVIVGSVYIPHTRKSEFLRDLAVVIKGLHARYTETPIILGGDWNCKLNVITRWIQTNELNAESFRGRACSPVNHYPQWMTRCIGIDHFVTFYGGEHLFENEISNETVIRSKWDISDHCVVSHCRRWERNGAEDNNAPQNTENNDKLAIDRKALKETGGRIAFHNYWQPLSQQMDNMNSADEITSQFVETSYKVLEDINVRKRVVTSNHKMVFTPHHLKRKLLRLNRIRDAAKESGQQMDLG